MSTLVLRLDADPKIGIGHAMRCFALAEAARQRGLAVHLLYHSCPQDILEKYIRIGVTTLPITWPPFEQEDGALCANYANRMGGNWILLDSYQTTKGFIEAAQSEGLHVLAIDDEGRDGIMTADVIVNQNISANQNWYSSKHAASTLLLGTDYVMLRSDLRQVIQHEATQSILVTTGGTDDLNISPSVLNALIPLLQGIEKLRLVIGPANPNAVALKKTYQNSPQVELLENVQDMPSLLCDAKLVITGAGSTVWECLSLGVPFITMILAENQRAIAEELSLKDYAASAGDATSPDFQTRLEKLYLNFKNAPEAFSQRTEKGKLLIDGQGVFRILDTIQ